MSHPSDRHRGRRVALVLAAGVGAVALLAWLAAGAHVPAAVEDLKTAFPWSRAAGASAPVAAPTANANAQSAFDGGVSGWPPLAMSASASASASASGPGLAEPSRRVFRTDARGRLVVDQPMRLRAEALLALNEGEALAARVDAELADLPAPAAARARELVAQFEAYQTAQAAAFPPGQAPLVPEEGLVQLQTMQALRAAHFGAEAAREMFAQDDAVARRILELMREDTSTARSMEEKAMRAQIRYDQERGAVPP
ncbi:hypothetical protein ACQ86G_17670 [Roseateles chitinivorans]|uniref:hypothetical protein n=1 Tax=Roseateles chitinivorans TaxID=2917965 RepID=UPI003D66CF70